MPRDDGLGRGSRGALAGGGRARGAPPGACRQALRRPVRPAPRVGALGRGRLDAGDDGHDPQPRPQRRRGRGPRRRDGQPPLRLRLVPPPRADVRRGRRRDRRAPVRGRAAGAQGTQERAARRRPDGRRPARADHDLPGDLRARGPRSVPAGGGRAAPPRDARGLRLLGVAARQGLPAHLRHPRRPRDRGQRRPDGVRQQGRHVRDGRLLHAQPVDRRARALRRVPRQRAGRGRRRRDPHPGADRADARDPAGGVRPARRDARAARGPLPRDAGHRVHGRGRRALPAPDPHRQAHGAGGPARRRRDAGRGADLPRGGRRADRPRLSSTSCSTR